MNILYIHHTTRPLDGSTKALTNILESNAFHKACHATIVLPDQDGIFSDYTAKNYDVYCVTQRYDTYPPIDSMRNVLLFIPRLIGRLTLNISAILKICRIARKTHPDAIHSNVSITSIGYYAAKIRHIPHIWHLREYGGVHFNSLYYYPSFRNYKMRLQNCINYPICISEGIKQHFGLSNNNQAFVIYDGVFTYTPKINWEKGTYFLYVGTIDKMKGIEDVLYAYSSFLNQSELHKQFKLKIAGGSTSRTYQQYIYTLCDELNISKYVDFLGLQPDLRPLYSTAYGVIVASYSEGFGFVMAEAMNNGALVIGRNVSGTKEQFDNGYKLFGQEIGIRYEDTGRLAQILDEVTTHGIDSYAEMIVRGQNTVSKLYTVDRYVQQIIDLYQSLFK